jgi:hypothetical protein
MNTREQGDIGELSAMQWLAGAGARLAIPVGHSPDWDLIAEMGGRLLRVQVKTCGCWVRERWSVSVCTRGGNRSWSGLVKRLDSSRFDYLFVLVGDGRRWFIPAKSLGGDTHISLGGPKYSEYEVDRGAPLPARTGRTNGSRISASARGDVRAAKGDAL